MSAFMVTSFVALHDGTSTVKLSPFRSALKPSEVNVSTILSLLISMPVYLFTKALSKVSITVS